MDVRIDDVRSTVRTTDSQTLLSPQLLELITERVLERLEAKERRRVAGEAERRLLPEEAMP